MRQKRMKARLGALLLLITPPLFLGLVRALRWIDAVTAQRALRGMAITAIGGLIGGILAERLLHRGRNEWENVIGLIAVTTVGVLTIGYHYLVHVGGPMSTVGSLPRAVLQGLGFIEFLTAQGAGIVIADAIAKTSPHSTAPPQSSRQ